MVAGGEAFSPPGPPPAPGPPIQLWEVRCGGCVAAGMMLAFCGCLCAVSRGRLLCFFVAGKIRFELCENRGSKTDVMPRCHIRYPNGTKSWYSLHRSTYEFLFYVIFVLGKEIGKGLPGKELGMPTIISPISVHFTRSCAAGARAASVVAKAKTRRQAGNAHLLGLRHRCPRRYLRQARSIGSSLAQRRLGAHDRRSL